MVIMSPEQKRELQPKVRKYRMEFDKLKRDFNRASEAFETKTEREKLISTELSEDDKDYKARLLNQQDRLRVQNEQLANATKTMYETDKVSFDIVDGLRSQNILASKTRSKVKNIFNDLGESDTIVSRMLKREKLTKIALSGIMLVCILAVLFILYKKTIG